MIYLVADVADNDVPRAGDAAFLDMKAIRQLHQVPRRPIAAPFPAWPQ